MTPGFPRKPSEAVFVGERRRSGVSELSRLRGSEGYEACADERAKDLKTRSPSRRAGAQETIPLVVLMQFRSLRLQPDKQSEKKEGVLLSGGSSRNKNGNNSGRRDPFPTGGKSKGNKKSEKEKTSCNAFKM